MEADKSLIGWQFPVLIAASDDEWSSEAAGV